MTGCFRDKKEIQKSLSLIGFILFNYIEQKICTIDEIENKIGFFNSITWATDITYSVYGETTKFDFYSETMLSALKLELESSYKKIKEIN